MQCKIFIFNGKDSNNRVATGIFKWMSNEIFDNSFERRISLTNARSVIVIAQVTLCIFTTVPRVIVPI